MTTEEELIEAVNRKLEEIEKALEKELITPKDAILRAFGEGAYFSDRERCL